MGQAQAIEHGDQSKCMAYGAAQVVISTANSTLADSSLMTFPALNIDLSVCEGLVSTEGATEEIEASESVEPVDEAPAINPMVVAAVTSLLEGTVQVLTSYGDSFRQVDCVNFQRTSTGLRYVQSLVSELVAEITMPDFQASVSAMPVDVSMCSQEQPAS